jgi:hypothetical protein
MKFQRRSGALAQKCVGADAVGTHGGRPSVDAGHTVGYTDGVWGIPRDLGWHTVDPAWPRARASVLVGLPRCSTCGRVGARRGARGVDAWGPRHNGSGGR